jgi:hypothetical protein
MQVFCQFKKLKTLSLLIIVILISSCAKETIVRPIKPIRRYSWFNAPKQFALQTPEGDVVQHLFFDSDPVVNLENNFVDVLVTIPKDSKHHYDLDLYSGRRYYSHTYCEEEDVWNAYQAELEYPPYTEGIIPRILDLFKRPQRVIVFGERKYVDGGVFPNDELLRVRVVGGVVEQFCDKYPCKRGSKWRNRVVLVAVSTIDPKFENIKNMSQLKEVIDWSHVRAFMENAKGRTISDKDYYPAYRLVNQIQAEKAIRYALDNGHVFKKKELRTLRNTCQALYGKLWQIRQDVFKKEDAVPFRKSFLDFYRKYWSGYETCTEFVRYSNIQEDPMKHWYYEYMRAFSLVQKLGYVYLCDKSTWVRNVKDRQGRQMYDQVETLSICNSEQINLAFEKAVNLLTGLPTSGGKFFKYVDYDHEVFELNNKLYSWISHTGKFQYCSKKRHPRSIYPGDVSWEPLYTEMEKNAVKVYKAK